MIGLTFALPTESCGFRRLLINRRDVSTSGVEVLHGEIHGKGVALLHTGVGRKICEQRIRDFLRAQPITCLISSGFAGALDDNISVGELLVAENFSDPNLLGLSRDLLVKHRAKFGRLHTATTMIDDASGRAALATETGAVAVDMETEFIAHACSERNIPMLSLRVISDTPLQSLPAPPAVLFDLNRQRTPLAALAFHLTTHPMSVPRLIGFARQISRAREALTSALVELLLSERF